MKRGLRVYADTSVFGGFFDSAKLLERFGNWLRKSKQAISNWWISPMRHMNWHWHISGTEHFHQTWRTMRYILP